MSKKTEQWWGMGRDFDGWEEEGERNFPVGSIHHAQRCLFSANLWVCVEPSIVTNTYIVMLGFMIEDRLSK